VRVASNCHTLGPNLVRRVADRARRGNTPVRRGREDTLREQFRSHFQPLPDLQNPDDHSEDIGREGFQNESAQPTLPFDQAAPAQIDSLYLFACHAEWARHGEPGAAWELISAAQSAHESTRAGARSLLAFSHQIDLGKTAAVADSRPRPLASEASMKTPYGLEIIENCASCKPKHECSLCGFSPSVMRSLNLVSHHSILPSGALLFVEGQTPRGIFVLCSGRVKLSTTSKEGKVLILKQAEAGEPLGLSAAISGTNYEMTAETATPCQINFVDRKDLLTLLQFESEVSMRAAQWLSRDFQAAYRDMHDLVLARSSAGKLARLLLSCAHLDIDDAAEVRLRSPMTHEEMAQRIGASRETVTRLLSNLKKKELIRLEGATLIIRRRTELGGARGLIFPWRRRLPGARFGLPPALFCGCGSGSGRSEVHRHDDQRSHRGRGKDRRARQTRESPRRCHGRIPGRRIRSHPPADLKARTTPAVCGSAPG